MRIWHRSALFVSLLAITADLCGGCGYRLGSPVTSVDVVSYSFHTNTVLAPHVESVLRQGAWNEVHRRVDMGDGCDLRVSVVGVSYTPSLGGLSHVELSLEGQFGVGDVVSRIGRRSFTANSPQEADEKRLISYGTLATSLVSEIVLQLLTNGELECR
jgi:hypothetical protein